VPARVCSAARANDIGEYGELGEGHCIEIAGMAATMVHYAP
jgi:hypothetical protein